ncbi:hypothetical protein Tco_0799555 [Tanacetum coccineum]|uniref:Uncharacterized protein n=1 Tax=Tanacetum coccineum TaxID=301880 RepID=A0ABQ4ZTX1_9ASTR
MVIVSITLYFGGDIPTRLSGDLPNVPHGPIISGNGQRRDPKQATSWEDPMLISRFPGCEDLFASRQYPHEFLILSFSLGKSRSENGVGFQTKNMALVVIPYREAEGLVIAREIEILSFLKCLLHALRGTLAIPLVGDFGTDN